MPSLTVEKVESMTVSVMQAIALIAENETPEKRRKWKTTSEPWKLPPPTNRQIKILRFFGVSSFAGIDRGKAASQISKLLNDEENSEKWTKYKVLTGDIGDDSPELTPFDPRELEQTVIPPNWEVIEQEAKRKSEKMASSSSRQTWETSRNTPSMRSRWCGVGWAILKVFVALAVMALLYFLALVYR